MSYTDTFGSATVPSAKSKFAGFNLTADATFFWAYNSSDTPYQIADIMEVTTTAGLNLNFPAANQVSVGESALVRNIGANTFTIKDASGGTLGTVAAGTAKLFYINNNSTVAGIWSVLTFGTGTSSADATTLQGLGLLAISATLNDNHPVTSTTTAYTITSADRASTLVFTGGSVNATLPTLATAGNGFSLRVKNNGSGTITFVPQGAETIDQVAIVPGESVFLVAGTSGWITVGYGRSTAFSFTRLNKSLTGFGPGTDATLTSVEAGNKIINFSGSPSGDTNVIFPAISSIYFVSSSLSTATITLKTGTGATVSLGAGAATVVVCDGVNFSVALSSTYASTISIPSGSVASPSIFFTASVNTGFYRPYGGAIGIVANGAERIRIDNSSGVFTNSTTNSWDIGRIAGGAWTPANLRVGYGTIQASYNGSVGVQIIPAVSSNNITLDPAMDSSITTKAGTFNSVGTSFNYTTSAAKLAWTVVTTGATTFSGDVLLDGASGLSSLGYTVGTGGVVTQATSKSTGVTLNKITGAITTAADALAATTSVAFTLTNSLIGANDFVGVSIKSGAASNLTYSVGAVATAAGSCVIKIRNDSAGSLSEALVLTFVVIKGAVA